MANNVENNMDNKMDMKGDDAAMVDDILNSLRDDGSGAAPNQQQMPPNMQMQQQMPPNMQMQQQLEQMKNINNQTTIQSNNTPANTLEITPPEPSANPRAVAARGSKPENGQNVPADKLQESFTSAHQNTTLNNYKSSFLSPESFFSY